MSYSVGRENKETTLTIADGVTSAVLTLNEKATVQLIKLLAATLENYHCDVWPHININEKEL